MSPYSPPMVALFDVGGGELVLIGVVALLLFGGDLPKVMRQVGRVVADLRRQAENLTSEFRDDVSRSQYPQPRVPRPQKQPASLPVDSSPEDAAPRVEASTATAQTASSDVPVENTSTVETPADPSDPHQSSDRKERSDSDPGPN